MKIFIRNFIESFIFCAVLGLALFYLFDLSIVTVAAILIVSFLVYGILGKYLRYFIVMVFAALCAQILAIVILFYALNMFSGQIETKIAQVSQDIISSIDEEAISRALENSSIKNDVIISIRESFFKDDFISKLQT